MRSSPAAMAESVDVTAFQRLVLTYTQQHRRVGANFEHVRRMELMFGMKVPLRNLELAIKILRAKRMLALDPASQEFGLAERGLAELRK
jgi:hypothetical protein